MPPIDQLVLPFGNLRNRDLFSSHWLEHRLRLEPEWAEVRALSDTVMNRLSEVWRVQRGRVAQYGAEQPLDTRSFNRFSQNWAGESSTRLISAAESQITRYLSPTLLLRRRSGLGALNRSSGRFRHL